MNYFLKRAKSTLGYTIDQTILIVAVIAILITMIIASVGWDLLTRAGGTKLSSHLKQMETANGQFFGKHGVWPHQATNDSDNPFNALINRAVLEPPYASGFENLLPSYPTAEHQFGGGGPVYYRYQGDEYTLADQAYIVFELESVPRGEAERADRDIDGIPGAEEGRFQYAGEGNTVTVRYFANILN